MPCDDDKRGNILDHKIQEPERFKTAVAAIATCRQVISETLYSQTFIKLNSYPTTSQEKLQMKHIRSELPRLVVSVAVSSKKKYPSDWLGTVIALQLQQEHEYRLPNGAAMQ